MPCSRKLIRADLVICQATTVLLCDARSEFKLVYAHVLGGRLWHINAPTNCRRLLVLSVVFIYFQGYTVADRMALSGSELQFECRGHIRVGLFKFWFWLFVLDPTNRLRLLGLIVDLFRSGCFLSLKREVR